MQHLPSQPSKVVYRSPSGRGIENGHIRNFFSPRSRCITSIKTGTHKKKKLPESPARQIPSGLMKCIYILQQLSFKACSKMKWLHVLAIFSTHWITVQGQFYPSLMTGVSCFSSRYISRWWTREEKLLDLPDLLDVVNADKLKMMSDSGEGDTESDSEDDQPEETVLTKMKNRELEPSMWNLLLGCWPDFLWFCMNCEIIKWTCMQG